MARNRTARSTKARKAARPDSAPPTFREAIAYMHGVADAVSVRAPAAPEVAQALEPGASDASEHRRPTLRYGEVPSHPPEAPAARRRTLPYGAPEGPAERPALELSSAPPEIAWEAEVFERPSGIRLRTAPLVQEWYELAGAERRR
jgi:hypothetical protein